MKTRLLLFLFITIFICSCAPDGLNKIKNIHSARGTNLICFGDSLTAGQGASPGNDFPTLLQEKLSIPVINAGISGHTTFHAQDRVESDVLMNDPKIVIVEFGGNDYLKWGGGSADNAYENLATAIQQIQDKNAVVVIAAIPFDYYYKKMYKKLAKDKGAYLIEDILKDIFGNRQRMHLDRTHPNNEGYKVMAENIFESLKPLLDEMGVAYTK